MNTQGSLRRSVVIGLIALSGCGGGSKKASAPATATLLGSVKSVGTTTPVPLATISVGDVVVQTNESGWFVIPDLPEGDRVLVNIEADGMVPTQRVVELSALGRTFLDARLFPMATAVKVDPTTGGTVTSGRAKLVVGPGTLTTMGGAAPSGMASVSLTIIDPTSREQRLATPGDFSGVMQGQDAIQSLESFGMIYLSMTDEAGDELTFAPSSPATVSIPAPTGGGAPLTTTPTWTYDQDSGLWVSAGTATYDTGTQTYTTTIDRPRYWNCDQPYATACWTGQVVTPEGMPAPAGIKVAAEGTNYIGESISWTDDNGRFAVRVMASTATRSATARVYAEGTGRYADLPSTATPTVLASTGTCTDLGSIQLAFPLASMVLTWGETPHDLDSHFTGPTTASATSRFHVYYSQRSVDGAFLDTDDTSSYGPEVTSLLKAVPGTYVYAIDNFSGEASGPIAASMAQVIAIFPEEERTFQVTDAAMPAPITTSKAVWRVFKFDIDAAGRISPLESINTIVNESPDAYQP
ncbi:MAG TPA: hypothetical protein VMT03_04805 [Polyangia bacterium]|nr:hypothetical protein [Polyangia bacterium]